MGGSGRRGLATWIEVEALPELMRAAFTVRFQSWSSSRFAVAHAHKWPMTARRLIGLRNQGGGSRRRQGAWPDCYFEHESLRDLLLTVYLWDQELRAAKDGPLAANRAVYQEHVRNVVVPEVQEIAHMCALGHVDPAEVSVPSDLWQPAPPPLPGRDPALVVPPPPPPAAARPDPWSPLFSANPDPQLNG
jgi:hypothetical protein